MLSLRNVFVAERSEGGIRDFFMHLSKTLYFKYFITSLSFFIIIIYVISSIIHAFSNNKRNETFDNKYLSEFILEYSLNTTELHNEKHGTKLTYYVTNNKKHIKDDTYTTQRTLYTTINPSLQNGDFSNIQTNITEETVNSEEIKLESFDIEKIINDLHLPKEKRVAVIAKELGINRKNEKSDYAKLAGIEGNYVGSLEQNQKIRSYLIANAQEIYKDKHGRNEWENLDLVTNKNKEVKLNTEVITGQVTYNNVTLNVTAPIGSFPEGSILKIKTLGDNDSMTSLDITLKEVQLMAQVDKVEFDAPMASFDISFYAKDDIEFANELQPAEGKSISVIFDYADNNEFKNSESQGFLAVYHMEDNDKTSIANLVGIKDNTKNNKSDPINILANELSVYILTVVSDLDEDIQENNGTITFDVGFTGFILEDENIMLSSSYITDNSGNYVYTGKILSKDNSITLPKIATREQVSGGWYSEDIFVGNAGNTFKFSLPNNLTGEQTPSINKNDTNYTLYACIYKEEEGNICSINHIFEGDSDSDDINNVDIYNQDEYTRSEEDIQKYGQELFDAYNRAIDNGITSIDNINKAKLNTEITREELAKMISIFIADHLGEEPIITTNVTYKDVAPSSDLAPYIQLAYQYQIMGINADGSPLENFDPKKPVSRGEFATVLSRILFGNSYNQSGDNYYQKHIEALNNANILNNTNPDINEWRGWIITMLYRSRNIVPHTKLDY